MKMTMEQAIIQNERYDEKGRKRIVNPLERALNQIAALSEVRSPFANRPTVKESLSVQSEKELQDQIANYLRVRGVAFQRCRMDKATTGTLGWPDFSLAINGKAVAFEVKTPTGKLSDDQSRCIELMRSNGWRVSVVTSLESVKKEIDELEKAQ